MVQSELSEPTPLELLARSIIDAQADISRLGDLTDKERLAPAVSKNLRQRSRDVGELVEMQHPANALGLIGKAVTEQLNEIATELEAQRRVKFSSLSHPRYLDDARRQEAAENNRLFLADAKTSQIESRPEGFYGSRGERPSPRF